MNEIKIKKGVKMPETGAGRPLKWPFDKMDVGDCFDFPKSKYFTVSRSAGQYGDRHDKKFSIRGFTLFRVS